METSGDVHVYPVEQGHVCSEKCWCEPELDRVAEDGTKVWIHRELQ
jgi:hypothetical protein